MTASDKTYTITNTYDTDIPDDDIPLSDIPDDDVPLADIPDDDVPLTEIPDDDVPLTGDSSRKGLWMALAACSALGMIITGKKWKRKEDDETGEI